MQDLERRMSQALARIGQGLDHIAASRAAATAPPARQTPDAGDAPLLRAQLEAERAVTAQLRAELARSAASRDLDDELARANRQLDVQGIEMLRMRKTIATLREALRLLREDQAHGVTDPGHINRAMAAELDALRSTRLAEIAEMDEILAELDPMIAAGGAHA